MRIELTYSNIHLDDFSICGKYFIKEFDLKIRDYKL